MDFKGSCEQYKVPQHSYRLDEQVQPVAVSVPSHPGRAHEGGRQGLVWMAAFGLGFSG